MFRVRAVGFIVAGAKLKSPITARYADAPAWPTDAYRAAAARKAIAMTTVSEVGIRFQLYLFPLDNPKVHDRIRDRHSERHETLRRAYGGARSNPARSERKRLWLARPQRRWQDDDY